MSVIRIRKDKYRYSESMLVCWLWSKGDIGGAWKRLLPPHHTFFISSWSLSLYSPPSPLSLSFFSLILLSLSPLYHKMMPPIHQTMCLPNIEIFNFVQLVAYLFKNTIFQLDCSDYKWKKKTKIISFGFD